MIESPSALDSKDGLTKGFRATLGILTVVKLLRLKKTGKMGVKVD